MAYDSMMVMAEGLKAAAPEFNPDDIMAGVKSVKDYDLASGCITMDENGDANRDILIVRLSGAEDGKPTYEVVK
jgi:ABC-type branched-subunit amino acid transport system substrate-binding protein